MLTVSWVKFTDDLWFSLNNVNLNSLTEKDIGVYIIWHGGDNANMVKIGQGIIKNRLVAHKKDKEIQAYSHLNLYVTWAYLQESLLDGVEAYLAEVWPPLVGERFPDRKPIAVTLPFGQKEQG